MNVRTRAYHFGMAVLMTLALAFGLLNNMSIAQAADISATNRHLVVTYTRDAKDYQKTDGTWSLWVWEVGGGEGSDYAGEVIDGNLVIDIPVSQTCEEVGMVLHKTVGEDQWAEKDGGDRIVTFPVGQNVKRVNIEQDKDEVIDAPDNIGHQTTGKQGEVEFLYRDDNAYYAGTQMSMRGTVTLEVDGQIYDMEYDEDNKRFTYTVTGLTDGKHYYRYFVGETAILDAYNENTEEYKGNQCSYITYSSPSLSVQLSTDRISYNENTVIQIITSTINAEDVASITADLSAIGGSSTFAIEPELMEATIGVLEGTELGAKEIPVTITLNTGTVFNETVTLNVVERTLNADYDFDWDEAIIYFMVTDRFFDGNASNNEAAGTGTYGTDNAGLYHGGDFAGVTAKLDYLKDLGINTIWITPIVDNVPSTVVSGYTGVSTYAAYHGYWARDFEKLNAALGTEQEFRTLISEAHARGIKIMVDVVLNHSGYGTSSASNFSGMLRSSSATDVNEIYSSVAGLPDFLTELPKVRDQLIAWQTAWMTEYDIDYFRVDTVKHVDDVTWKAFKNALTKEDPSFKLIGERWDASYTNSFGHLGTGTMDSVLDFSFKTYAKNFAIGNMTGTELTLKDRNESLNNTATLGSFLSSHDEDGLLYSLIQTKGEETARKLIMAAASLQITAKGQPVIYYGEEIGLTGANNYPYQDNRYDFDWSLVSDDNPIYTHYKKMLNIRQDYSKVFAKGNRTSLSAENRAYSVFSRTYNKETIIVGINIKDEVSTTTVQVPFAAGVVLKDVYNNKTYTVGTNKTIDLSIPAVSDGGTVVLVATDGATSDEDSTGDDTEGVLINVVIEGNGGKVSDTIISVKSGSAYGELPTATRAGYTFKGWYTQASGGTKITATTTVVSETTHSLYAQWTAKSYKLKFNAKGGKSSTSSKTVKYYGSYGTLPTATRTGYTFKGWYTSAGTKVSSASKHKKAGDVTLYAKWSTNKYKITFDANGGKISGTNDTKYTKSYLYGGKYGTLKNANRSGYVFKGWYTSKSYSTKVTSSSVMRFTTSRTLYAKWSKVTKPSQGKISSLKSASSKKMTVAIGRVSGAEGYEIQYSVKSGFSSNYKTVRTTKLSYTISSLSSNQKYYVRVRAYKLDSRKSKVYGAWSSKKTVTVK